MIKKKAYFLILIFLYSWSCIGTHYYDLYIEPSPIENSVKIDKILMVEDVWTNDALWRQSMVIRRSPYRLEYLHFDQWARIPEEMIKNTIIRFYKNSSLFANVIDSNYSLEPDILMRVHIDALEMLHEDKQWHSRLALDIEFVDFKTEKTFFTHYFDRKLPIEGKKPRYVPEKISIILQEELLIIFEKLRKIKSSPNAF